MLLLLLYFLPGMTKPQNPEGDADTPIIYVQLLPPPRDRPSGAVRCGGGRGRSRVRLSGPSTHGAVAQPLHLPPRRLGILLLLSKEAWSQDGRSPRRRDVPSPELIWQHSRR